MKKSELKKLIKEVISEQFSQGTYCEPGPNCVEPILTPISGAPEEMALVCPGPTSGPGSFVFEYQETSDLLFTSGGQVLRKIPRCVPNIDSPGDVCEDFNQLTGEQQQLTCQAYNNMTPGSNPSLEAIGENCCDNIAVDPNVPSQGGGTGSMLGMPQSKPQFRRR